MIELKPFQTRVYAASTAYDLEFSGRAVSAIGLRFAATLTGSPATVRDDAAFRLLGTPEVNQAENPLIRMSGPSWRHLSAVSRGGYDKYAAGVTASTAGQVIAQSVIDLEALMPGAMINATDKKVFLRGEFGALAVYSATPPTTVVGTLRPWAKSTQRNAQAGFVRPKISQADVQIVAAAEDQQHVWRFEQDTLVQGFMLESLDTSASNQRVDGVVRSLRGDLADSSGGTRETLRQTWGNMRTLLQYLAGFNQEDYDRSVGVAFFPTKDMSNPQYGNARLFRAGESITFHIDSTSTVEEEFTAVTPSNDLLRLTCIGFTPVAGSGDMTPQIASGALATASRAQTRSALRAQRRRR